MTFIATAQALDEDVGASESIAERPAAGRRLKFHLILHHVANQSVSWFDCITLLISNLVMQYANDLVDDKLCRLSKE
jgi:adenosyl cobinamide kinase/adenosyl cobinamide phosphate guanylyltransferase